MESLICNNICKKYKDKTVLDNVNLTIEHGKIYGLIGRNGAGKTTLLSIMSAQNPATDGSVTIGDKKVWENAAALADICFARELNSGSCLATMQLKKYLKTASLFYRDWDNDMAEKLVKIFELDEKKVISELSKGMMSMVTIIVALASKAAYTFLDEPVAGLDVVAREQFYKLLIDEYSNTGRTFIISTHIIDEASDVFEEVIFLNDKKIMLKENTQELLNRAVYVSGRDDAVDAAVTGMKTYGTETLGRQKAVTVLLNEGQHIEANADIDVHPVTLQHLFTALCGSEIKTL